MLTLGEIFTLVAYGHLILEQLELDTGKNPKSSDVSDLIDMVFDFMIRDFSRHSVTLYGKASVTDAQQKACLSMIKRPLTGKDVFDRVSQRALSLSGSYTMPE